MLDNGADMMPEEKATMSPSMSLCSDSMPEVGKCEVGKSYMMEVKAKSKNTHQSEGKKDHTDVSFEIMSMKPTNKKYAKKVSEYGAE